MYKILFQHIDSLQLYSKIGKPCTETGDGFLLVEAAQFLLTNTKNDLFVEALRPKMQIVKIYTNKTHPLYGTPVKVDV